MTETGDAGSPVRVALICGSRLMSETLGAALACNPGIDLVGSADSARPGLAMLATLDTEVVLIDTELGEAVVIGLIESIRNDMPSVRVVPAGACEVEQIVRFIEAGALGYICRQASFEEMLASIRAARRGEALCAPAVAAAVYARIHALASLARHEPPTLPETLTSRELEVLRLMAGGLRNKEIAGRLGVTLSTAKNHVHAVIAKLDAGHRREAVLLACRSGLVPPAGSYLRA